MTSSLVKVVALDLDGTTLDKAHQISLRTIEILRRLSEKGVCIILATGRSHPDVLKYFDILQLPQQIRPGVSYNGTYGSIFMRNLHENCFMSKTIFHEPHTHENARRLIEFAAALGLVLQVRYV